MELFSSKKGGISKNELFIYAECYFSSKSSKFILIAVYN